MREATKISTISKIKHIFKENNITLNVINDGYHNGVYSVHLHLDCGLLQMGCVTNGKGITEEQALASAYGEMIERIQSFIIFPNREAFSSPFRTTDKYHYSKILPFHYAPDEKIISKGSKIELLLPFFDVKNQTIKYLDYRKIEYKSGSNGIAAGNNLREAFLYSIYEIFERYALRLIYDKSLTPPVIEKSNVNKWISITTTMDNYEIEIRDCSCGLGLPVIGILLHNTTNGDYRFSLSANYNPNEAIESAITEIFQAGHPIKFVHLDKQKMHQMLHDTYILEEERLKYNNGTNQLPISFWNTCPSYEISIDTNNKELDNISCLKKSLELISNLGYDLYVRDVSYLSYPTVITYIPGMSEIIDYDSDSWEKRTFGKTYEISLKSHRLPSLSIRDLDEFITFQSQFKEPVFISMFNKNDAWCTGNPHFVLGVIALYINKFTLALYHFDKLLEIPISNTTLKNIYACFRDFASHKNTELLYCKYSPHIVNIIKDCYEKGLWKTLFNLTNCFNCIECKFKLDCVVDHYYALLDRLMYKYTLNCPNQNHWKKILS